MFDFLKRKAVEATVVEERAITATTVDSLFSTNTSGTVTSVNSIGTAYSCVRLLSNSVAMTPLKHIENADKGQEELKTSRLTSLLKNPAPNTSYFQFMNNMTNYVSGTGNSFAIVIRDGGIPSELLFVPSDQISIYVTLDPLVPYYYQVSYMGKSSKLFPEDMLHFRNITDDALGVDGISPLLAHRLVFESASSMAEYSKVYMDNSTNIAGVITTDKKLNKETVEDLRANFSKKFAGANNSGKTPVLSEGMKYTQLKVVSPLDADYVKTRGLNKADISEIFGVPLSMLGQTDTTYSNAEQQALIFQRYTLNPLYEMMAQEMTLKLIPSHRRNREKFEFIPESFKLSSSKEKSETVSLLTNTGIITPNESRAYYGLPKLKGGDELKTEDTAKGEAVGEALQAPKTTDETNTPVGTPKTDANIATTNMNKRSTEDLEVELHRIQSELGRR